MADTKISALTDGTTAAATDRIPVARDPTGTPLSRYVTPAYIKNYMLDLSNTWTAAQTITQGTITADAPQLNGTATWNSGGTTFTGWKLNVTDTASAAASLLADFQVGGSSKFSIGKNGYFSSLNLMTSNSAVWSNNEGFYATDGATPVIGLKKVQINQYNGVLVASDMPIGFANSTNATVSDTVFKRALAKVFSMEGASSTGATYRTIATTPAQITADQNNYAPGGTSMFQRWSTDASRNITGLSLSQVDGQVHEIHNVGSSNIVLVNESASSTAANRFTNNTGADITLAANASASLIYDGTTSRWRVYKRP